MNLYDYIISACKKVVFAFVLVIRNNSYKCIRVNVLQMFHIETGIE